MRLSEEEIAKMLVELDSLLFELLAGELGVERTRINELLEPIRVHIGALAVALGVEEKFASFFANDRNAHRAIVNKLYEFFRGYLYYRDKSGQKTQ